MRLTSIAIVAAAIAALSGEAAGQAKQPETKTPPPANKGGTKAATKAAPPATKAAPQATKAAPPATKAARQADTKTATKAAPPPATKAAPAPALTIVPNQKDLRFAAQGETAALSARVIDQRTNRPVPRASILWRSASPAVATVSPNGQVEAKSTGNTRVWAVSGSDSVAIPVVVDRKATRLGFNPERVYLDAIGTWTQLRVDVRDARNNPMPDDRRTPPVCRIGDNYVATLTANGRITARNNGLVWIHCQRGDLRDSLRVEVRQRAARAQIIRDGPSYQLRNVGDSLRLGMIAVDRMGEAITDGWVTWISEEPAIAHVDVSTGVVLGISVGETKIVGRLDGLEDSVIIAVREPLPAGAIAARARERMPSRLPLPSGEFGAAVPEGELVSGQPSGAPARPAEPSQPLDRVMSLSLIPRVRETRPGDTVHVAAIPRNVRSDVLTGKTVTWSTGDTLIAAILPDGRLVARDTGRAMVIGAIDGIVDTAYVTIRVMSDADVASAGAAGAGGVRPPPGALPTATRRATGLSATGPRNPALVDSIIRTDVIGTSSMRSRFPRRSISLTPLVGFTERRVDDRAVGDESSPTVNVRGLSYGGQMDVAVNRMIGVQGLFLAGTLQPQNTGGGLEQTMAEMRGMLSVAVQPWFAINGGMSYRGYKRAVATDRWLTMHAGGELRMDFVGGALRGTVGATYFPTVKIDTVSNRPDLGIGAAAGLEYRARLFTAGLRYEVERYDFAETTTKHLEQFSSLRLRLGLLFGRY